MEQTELEAMAGQKSSLRAIRWAIAVERARLSAAIGDAIREVMNAERLLAAGVDVDGAARSLDAWTAILDSRITRLNSLELRYRNFILDAPSPSSEGEEAAPDRALAQRVGVAAASSSSTHRSPSITS